MHPKDTRGTAVISWLCLAVALLLTELHVSLVSRGAQLIYSLHAIKANELLPSRVTVGMPFVWYSGLLLAGFSWGGLCILTRGRWAIAGNQVLLVGLILVTLLFSVGALFPLMPA
jgi:hypothetical protein